jgi:hypothetical protein
MLSLLDLKALTDLEMNLLVAVTTKVVQTLSKSLNLSTEEVKRVLNAPDEGYWKGNLLHYIIKLGLPDTLIQLLIDLGADTE